MILVWNYLMGGASRYFPTFSHEGDMASARETLSNQLQLMLAGALRRLKLASHYGADVPDLDGRKFTFEVPNSPAGTSSLGDIRATLRAAAGDKEYSGLLSPPRRCCEGIVNLLGL